ncbi:MAG TPA: hypothetical protein VHB48_21240 [Chitinophagaceae bacterium]|nr:hypothetical protein [Chitinophagaceae bacterium]
MDVVDNKLVNKKDIPPFSSRTGGIDADKGSKGCTGIDFKTPGELNPLNEFIKKGANFCICV